MVKLFRNMVLAAGMLPVLFQACDEDSLLLPEESGIGEVVSTTFPDTVWIKNAYDFTVTARVMNSSDEELFIIGIVQFEQIPDFKTTFSLYDDGTHTDNIPRDNLYTTVVSSTLFEGNTGIARVHIFSATAIHEPQPGVQPLIKNVVVLDEFLNTPPLLGNLSAPVSVRYDLSEYTIITIEAADPQGLDDISSVTGLLFSPYAPAPDETIVFQDDGVGNDPAEGDGIYTGIIAHDTIESLGPGAYTLLVFAQDETGNKSSEVIQVITFDTERIGTPPEIIDVGAPDEIRADNILILLQVEVFDADGLSDIDRVLFFSVKPDGTMTNYGNPFFLYDDGGTGGAPSGDLVEGDGIYSITIFIPEVTPPGTYTFLFRAVDTIGLMSPFHEHPVVVY